MRLPRLPTMRLGVRLARRELWRRPWRSFLVLLMVLLPAFTMTVLVTFLRTNEYTRAELAAARYGQADAYARSVATPITEESLRDLRAGLPERSSVIVERSLEDRVRDGDRRAYFLISDLPLDDPMADGRFGSVRGRLPRGPGEAVINDEVGRDLGIGVGDSLRPELLGRSLRVVGTVRVRGPYYATGDGNSDRDGQVFVGGRLPDSDHVRLTTWIDIPGRRPALVTSDVTAGLGIAPIPGWPLFTIDAFDEADQTSGVFWTYFGGAVGLIVLSTIITAAFAVGARRQLVTIGQLSSSGASPRTIRWFLVAQGFVLGAVGSAAGVVAGVVAVQFTPRRVLDTLKLRVDDVVTRPLDLVPVVALGTVVAALAAWLPARTASKVPTLQALAGRRPLPRVPRRLPVLGAVSIVVGCATLGAAVALLRNNGGSGLVIPAIAGGTAVLLGSVAIAPWVVERIEHGSARWTEAWRLAGRSLGRSRVRSSAVVGALCTVSATVIAGTTLHASVGRNEETTCCASKAPHMRDDQVLVEIAGLDQTKPLAAQIPTPVRSIVPGAELVPLTDTSEPGSSAPASYSEVLATYVDERDPYRPQYGRTVGVATPELLDHLEVPEDLRAALVLGQAVSVESPPFETDEVRIGPNDTVLPLGGSFESPHAARALPTILVSREQAERLGLDVLPSWTVLLGLRDPMSAEQRKQLELVDEDAEWLSGNQLTRGGPLIDVTLPQGDGFETTAGWVKAFLLAISLLLVLGVVAVALALAARDSEDERQVLSAVGAPPRTLRRVGALRGALLVLAAAAIAVPAGLLAAAGMVAAWDDGPFRVDYWAVVFVIAVVPLVVGATALVGGRVRDAIRPTRPDVFAFGE